MHDRRRAMPASVMAVLSLVLLLGACTRFTPPAVPPAPDAQLVQTRVDGQVSVSAAVLTDAQAERRYGVNLGLMGIQAVWLRIDNRSALDLWLMLAALDPDYYTAAEASFLFSGGMSDENADRMAHYFRSLSMPVHMRAGQVNEGFVLTPRSEGGRYIDVELTGHDKRMRLGFAVTLPDGDFDYEKLDPAAIYPDAALPDLDTGQLRAALQALPCCTTDANGEGNGDPLNIVLVGSLEETLTALARSGWSFTHRITPRTVAREIRAAITGGEYPTAMVSPLHVFGRSHDFAMQRARRTIVQRNHMRLWLAPFRHEGRSVWVGQVSRDIGIKLTSKSPTLTTHVIGPDVDDAREYLLQSLMIQNGVARFGFVGGVGRAAIDAPRVNLTGDPYFTDGLRLVVLLSTDPVAPHNARNLHWEDPAPMLSGSSVDPGPAGPAPVVAP